MRKRTDFRQHSSPHLLVNNGQSTVISATRPRNYIRNAILRPDAWPGFEPEMGRGLFILSRSVGILAHALEQKQQGGRIKGPMPKDIAFTYSGPASRRLDDDSTEANRDDGGAPDA